jgi:hypothetical protein
MGDGAMRRATRGDRQDHLEKLTFTVRFSWYARLYQDAPRLTPSMGIALEDLRLDHLTVLYPGTRTYDLADRVTVVPVTVLATRDPRVMLPRARRR